MEQQEPQEQRVQQERQEQQEQPDQPLEPFRRALAALGEPHRFYLAQLLNRRASAVGELVVRSAQLRHESRGLHYTLDYPRLAHLPRETVIRDPAGGHI